MCVFDVCVLAMMCACTIPCVCVRALWCACAHCGVRVYVCMLYMACVCVLSVVRVVCML